MPKKRISTFVKYHSLLDVLHELVWLYQGDLVNLFTLLECSKHKSYPPHHPFSERLNGILGLKAVFQLFGRNINHGGSATTIPERTVAGRRAFMEANQTFVAFLFALDSHVGAEFQVACKNHSVDNVPESWKNEDVAFYVSSQSPEDFQLLLWSARRDVAAIQ